MVGAAAVTEGSRSSGSNLQHVTSNHRNKVLMVFFVVVRVLLS